MNDDDFWTSCFMKIRTLCISYSPENSNEHTHTETEAERRERYRDADFEKDTG